MASLLDEYQMPQALPDINGIPDPKELEQARYLALMRMGFHARGSALESADERRFTQIIFRESEGCREEWLPPCGEATTRRSAAGTSSICAICVICG